jgi:outer membrane protein OmpA-like peptidoglycan-associated protein
MRSEVMMLVAVLAVALSVASGAAQEAASPQAPGAPRGAVAADAEKTRGADADARAAGVVVNLDDNYFVPGTSQLRPEARERLGAVIGAARNNSKRQVLVEARVSGAGTQVENQQLALKRASSVRTLLAGQGIAADRIVVRGIGAAPASALPPPPAVKTSQAIRAARTTKPPTANAAPRTSGRVQVSVIEPKKRAN